MQETQETWVRFLGQEDLLEREMAIHFHNLVWTIPWTEEPGGLQSTGLQRVRHDRAHITLTSLGHLAFLTSICFLNLPNTRLCFSDTSEHSFSGSLVSSNIGFPRGGSHHNFLLSFYLYSLDNLTHT